LLALALIAAVTVMMFVLSPYGAHHGTTPHTPPVTKSHVPNHGTGT